MENKQDQNDDKTLFQGGTEKENAQNSVNQQQQAAPKSGDVHSDKTQVDNSDKTTISTGPERSAQQPKVVPPQQQEPTRAPGPAAQNEESAKISKLKESSKGFSGAQMAGAAAAAGIAGVAVGANFSDEIKEALSQDNAETAEVSPTNEATPNAEGESPSSNVPSENLNPTQASNVTSGTETPGVNQAEIPDSVEINYTDASGNTYCVSMTDMDGDGVSDITTGDIIFADGSSIQVVQYGDPISPALNDSMNYAGIEDYQSNPEFVSFPEQSDEPYYVETEDGFDGSLAGDQEIVELTPDEIMEDVENDISGEVEVTEVSTDTFTEVEGEIFGEVETDAISIADTNEFETVDWENFESEQESYVSNDDYNEELAATDFESYEMPDSYLMGDDDFGIADFL